jgi:hypothetical protein
MGWGQPAPASAASAAVTVEAATVAALAKNPPRWCMRSMIRRARCSGEGAHAEASCTFRASAARFRAFASARASYLTGTTSAVDGGMVRGLL